MKKRFLIISVIMLILIVVTGCSSQSIGKDAKKFKEEYESLNGLESNNSGVYYREINIDENNPITYTSFKEISTKIKEKESFVVYFGFSSCPWCRSVIPYVLESAKENNIKEILYVNLRSDNTRESDLRGYYKLDENNNLVVDVKADDYYYEVLDTLDKHLTPYTIKTESGEEIKTGENRLYAPTIVIYKEGKAVALDECISDNQTDGYEELTDKMINDMKSKANLLFKEYNK